jgi:hypothetical protein
MLFGIIILAVAVLVAYLLNKSKVSEAKIEAPEKIEPTAAEELVEETTETPVKKAKTVAKKKTAKIK